MTSANHILESVDQVLSEGQFLAAYDQASQGLKQFPDDVWLKHRCVLALARAGATEHALNRFDELSLKDAMSQGQTEFVEIGSLAGRLVKDLGLQSPPNEAAKLFRKSADGYLRVFEETNDPYPGVNAATLYLWSGEDDRAFEIATKCLRLEQQQNFYGNATRAEALLVLNRPRDAAIEIKAAAVCRLGVMSVPPLGANSVEYVNGCRWTVKSWNQSGQV